MQDQDIENLKIPPHSNEAEQSILGGLMLNNEAWDTVSDLVSEDDFYRYDHRLIFQSMTRLFSVNRPMDVVTLAEELDKNAKLDEVGGLAYLSQLAKDTPTAANIKRYSEIVRERSILRQLVQVGTEIANSAYQPDGQEVPELLNKAEEKMYQIAEQGSRGKKHFASMKELLEGVVDRIDELYQQDNPITGIPTGFTDFDMKTSGLQNGDLVIVAGRPSMGKTTFSMNLAEAAAINEGVPVAVFSLEMPGEQLAMRMLSSMGRIDASRMRTGKLEDEDWPKLTNAVGRMAEAPIFIDDTSGMSPTEIRARARRLKREHGLGLIVIDYLQLMRGSGNGGENRTTEISEISRSLKAMARELNVPVIALSQLNRSLEQRPNKRPIMSDLRESGAIEQDADVIVFVYRDEVYNEESPDKGTAEIIIGKQRNGPIGMVRLAFLGQYTRFENFAGIHDWSED